MNPRTLEEWKKVPGATRHLWRSKGFNVPRFGPSPSHRLSQSKEYSIWKAMKRRCSCSDGERNRHYLENKISVCSEWLGENGFQQFLADMGSVPNPQMTLERIDNHAGYFPGNVRWATTKEQSRNKSSNVWIRFEGALLCAIDACAGANIKYARVRHLVLKHKLSPQEAFDWCLKNKGGRGNKINIKTEEIA